MQLFYHKEATNDLSTFTLDKQESTHLIKVLRKNPGDEVMVTNGKGLMLTTTIVNAQADAAELKIVSCRKKHRRMHRTHLVVAPPKQADRYEWLLEKATEIGVDEITPVFCARSERDKINKNRLEKIILAAMKQSQRAYLPKLNEGISYEDYISQPHEGLLFIAHCHEEEKLDLKRRIAPDKDITILVGPEGDFTEEEVDTAYEKGFYPVSLGEYRLRTETAALVACATVNFVNTR